MEGLEIHTAFTDYSGFINNLVFPQQSPNLISQRYFQRLEISAATCTVNEWNEVKAPFAKTTQSA